MSSDNLINNGDFDNGLLSPWTGTGAEVTSAYGRFYVQLAGGAVNAFISQVIPVEPGRLYDFVSSFAKIGAKPSPDIAIVISFHDAACNLLGLGLDSVVPADRLPSSPMEGWLEVRKTTLTAPAGATHANVLISKLSQAGTAVVAANAISVSEAGGAGTPGPGIPAGTPAEIPDQEEVAVQPADTEPKPAAFQFHSLLAQLIGAGGGTVADGASVRFDTVVNYRSPDISYNTGTGEFTLAAAGKYHVSWWIADSGAESASPASFMLQLNDGTGVVIASPITSLETAGNAMITVNAAPATLALVNASGGTVFIASAPVQACIIITGAESK
jgi:hypothetical protein